jgi:hypothetical protein
VWLGSGIRQLAAPLQPLKYFEGMKMMNDMMRMNGDLDDMGMHMSLQQMDMNVVMYPEITGPKESSRTSEGVDRYTSNALSDIVTLNYAMLRSPTPTALPPGPVKELKFTLTGNMNRYLWAIDNRTVSETDRILIHKGENVRIILYNNSMMRHPMHLHGHFFRVVNGQGDHAPLKNVLDIMPMETDTIEFAATETGDWFFHCHILYHMMSGMGRVFTYEGTAPNPALPDAKKAARIFARDDKEWHFMVQNDFATNGLDGEAMYMNKRWNLQSEWRLGYMAEHGQEVETHFGRYFGKMQWLGLAHARCTWRRRSRGQSLRADQHQEQPQCRAHRVPVHPADALGLRPAHRHRWPAPLPVDAGGHPPDTPPAIGPHGQHRPGVHGRLALCIRQDLGGTHALR